jgi:hypothetical protein
VDLVVRGVAGRVAICAAVAEEMVVGAAATGLGFERCMRRGVGELTRASFLDARACCTVTRWGVATTIPTATPAAASAASAAARRGRLGGSTAMILRAPPGCENAAPSASTNVPAVVQRCSGRFAMPRSSTPSTARGSDRLRELARGGSSAIC